MKLRLVVTNNYAFCRDTFIHNIVVFPKVTAGFDFIAKLDSGCSPFITTFINKSINSTTYTWNFGDSTTSYLPSPEKTYINYTINDEQRDVKLKAVSAYGCFDTIVKKVIINHKPKASFFVNNTASCPPFDLTIYNNSSSSNTSYTWDYGDGSLLNNNNNDSITHSYLNDSINTKKYNIVLYALTNKSCRDTASLQVSVYPKVKALFDTIGRGCSPIEADFVNKSSPTAKDYFWNFGDGNSSIQKNPSHIFRNFSVENSTDTIWLKVLSEYGCTDSVSYGLVVYPKPEANFIVIPSLKNFPDSTFTIKNRTVPGPWNYDWTFADTLPHLNISDTSFNYSFSHWGNYNIKLVVGYGACADTTYQDIELVPPVPIPVFGPADSGCTPVTVFFNNKSVYGNSYYWDFDDKTSSSLTNPSHTFIDAREYNVTLTVSGDGGEAHLTKIIKVFPTPTVVFDVEPTTLILGDAIKCSNNTQDASIYLWDFGDGTTSGESDPIHKYTNVGNYTIKLIAYSDSLYRCSDSTENNIKVQAKCQIIFPNAFTPNMNGPSGGAYNTDKDENLNKQHWIFAPQTNFGYVTEYRLEIYNRWGELLFVSNDILVGWDGYYKGKLCVQDVYVYKATGKFINGSAFLSAGDITLLYRKKNN